MAKTKTPQKKAAGKKETSKKLALKTSKTGAKAGTPSSKALKPVAKSTKKAEPKVKLAITKAQAPLKGKGEKASKLDKKSLKIEVKAEIQPGQGSEEDEEDDSAPAGGGISAAGLAMAAATAGAETSAGSLKNFRHHPDIENFYRFIFENDLRYEALEIIDVMASQRETIKATRAARARPN